MRLLVQNYSISEKAFLPNILNFSLKQVYPIIVNVSQAYYNIIIIIIIIIRGSYPKWSTHSMSCCISSFLITGG